MELKGSVAVITGGASGIGEAVSKYLSKAGAKVVIGDINDADISRVVSEIKLEGGDATAVKCDVTKDEDQAALMDKAIALYGKINVAIPCAGIIKDGLMISTDKETGKVKKVMDSATFRSVVEVNLTGTFITLREAASRMIDNKWPGVLFTVSSVNKAGQVGQMNYSATKVAAALWPKVLAGEFQLKKITGIRVVGIAPGYVGTPMVKGMNQDALQGLLSDVHIGRLIEPDEIADIIASVIRNEAIDGTTIEITGGLTYKGAVAK